MLTKLKIENYALIRNIEIDFDAGFSAITGETGAGKSILLGALSLILGERADMQALQDKDKKCIVEAEFDISSLDLKNIFETEELDYDDMLLMRREILPTGKSRAFINDTPATLVQMKEIGGKLLDIHSQHESLTLGNSDFQLNLVDNFLKKHTVLENYMSDFEKFRQLSKEWSVLRENDSILQQEKDYNTFLFNELNEINLKEGEQDSLEEELQMLNNAGELQELLSRANEQLSGSEYSILNGFVELNNNVKKVAKIAKSTENILERLNSNFLDLKDITYELSTFADKIEFDPQRQQICSEKLDKIYHLENKHRVNSIAELLQMKENLLLKLDIAAGNSEKIAQLETEITALEKNLNILAENIHNQRIEAAKMIEEEIGKMLLELGMANAKIKIVLEQTDNFGKNGKDKVSLLFSANVGSSPKEISKVASGGEMSRLMLAIKSVINSKNMLPTIIFDEIDSGVSGDIAGKVAVLMKKMSENMQIIAITHLPQLAGKANAHYLVFKEENINTTVSKIKKLSPNERQIAIASMISNTQITDAALAAATELLK
ncbi:DNA repair protein RecN [Bacteroidia bacterium]|nr:DNA repair protein RecN [Bacteroidia bacterium]